MSRHRPSRFKVISAARLTARLRPNAVIRLQVEHEIVFLLGTVDFEAVGAHHLKAAD